ncbi:MAG: TetR/AcrR family transcriptional regulator [Sandaracinaceae bacterium]
MARAGKRKIPKQARSRSLVDAVVEGAVQLLGKTGREDVSINRIAQRVGIGSIYRYFASRDGVLNAVVDRMKEENFQRFERLLDEHRESSLEQAVEALLEELTAVYLAQPALTRASITTVLSFGRLIEIIRERDRLVELLAIRIADECHVSLDEARTSARASADMAMGVVISEIYWGADEAQLVRAWATVRRGIHSELRHLHARE